MRILTLTLLALLLSGCSLFGKEDGTEPMELVDFDSTAKLVKVWSTSVGDGQGPGLTRMTPVIDGDILYAADYEGMVMAINRLTGKKLWVRDLDELLAGGVGLGAGKLFLGGDNGEIIVLDAANNGAELWRAPVSGEVMSVPAGDDAVVAVQTLDGRLTVFDSNTGTELWFYENPPPRLTLRGRPSPVITSSAVYAAFASGRLMAFNPKNGLILWEQRVAMPKGRSDLEKMVDVQAAPLLRDGILYVSGYQGRLMAIGRANGRPLWAIDSSSYQELALEEEVLYVTDSDSKVLAYSATSGAELWNNAQMLRRLLTGPQVLGGYVVAADDEGYLHVMNKADGQFADRTRIDRSGVRAPLLAAGEMLYVMANDGTLAAYRVTAR